MRPPIVLSIAGSDPSGGAGIQADLKTFTALGVYGAAAITGLTVQNTQGVRRAEVMAPDLVVEQVTAVLDDLPVAATKIGMLGNAAVTSAVARLVAQRRHEFGILVLDPVMVATSGDRLLDEAAVAALRDEFMPLADVVTPNLPEAGVLLGEEPATDPDGMERQARALLDEGARAVLLKGGHLAGGRLVDVFATPGHVSRFTGELIETRNTHGTGCTLSSAIAAKAALVGRLDADVIAAARDYLTAAIASGAEWGWSRHPGTGHGPVNHLVEGF